MKNVLSAILFLFSAIVSLASSEPMADPDLVFEEIDGVVAVEAEHFLSQEKGDVRAWYRVDEDHPPGLKPDPDGPHLLGSSGAAYLEALPDTRTTHDDTLVIGENFFPTPGEAGILTYKIHFNNPGRYHVWVRHFSTGSEDNGVHVGLNGTWPESGKRWQTTIKRKWAWESRQRTEEVHKGVRYKLYLDIPEAGEHRIHFSIREDGFEFDKFVLAADRDYVPQGLGPDPVVKAGKGGGATVTIRGERKQWHKVTFDLEGPEADEMDTDTNPFLDYRFDVTVTHASGSPSYVVPGYFAADGDAGNSSATSGTIWRAHFSPDKTGDWTYAVSFLEGPRVSIGDDAGIGVAPYHGVEGTFSVSASDKTGRDFRAHGRLQYVGKHHLQFAGSGQYFLKAGPDAPETLLAYTDFDNTEARIPGKGPLKTWAPHVQDWLAGDPTWQDGKGKALIGALNYLAAKGVNAFSFLTYNAGGDGDNVWPYVERDEKFHFDVSKLDQWGILFDHAQANGLYLHFKLQENESDDNRQGPRRTPKHIPEALDGGNTGPERKLYLRELIARYGYLLALNWNLGEENTQSYEQQTAMARYIQEVDPYDHLIVIHTFPPEQALVYEPLLGQGSPVRGASAQNKWNAAHQRTLTWVTRSAEAGVPWVVANDEQNPAGAGVPPDPGYKGANGLSGDPFGNYDLHGIRKFTLWGNLMAGGAGVEYYFGYKLLENDLLCEDWRSRDQSWDYCRHAIDFFQGHQIPFWKMQNANALVGNAANENSRYCLAGTGDVYVVYLPRGGAATLDLTGVEGRFAVSWYDPRNGGSLQTGTVTHLEGGQQRSLGKAPSDPDQDWAILVRRK